MIECKCNTDETVKLSGLTPFQGGLKLRSNEDIAKLAESLKTDGLLMPFAVWKHENKNYLLDGHGRMAALVHIALTDPEVLTQEFPCIVVDAETENDARKALLNIVSMCGRISPKGVLEFSAPVLECHAPVLEKVQRKVIKKETKKDGPEEVLIKIRVRADKADELRAVLSKMTIARVV